MHLFSVTLVCGVHCVMANGKPTAGMVLAFFSEPASLCLSAAIVVEGAVPDSGCTHCKRSCADISFVKKNTTQQQHRFLNTELFSISIHLYFIEYASLVIH